MIFFESNGVQIRYILKGSGEPVVLIHGFATSIETMWIGNGFLEMLPDQFQVIALDCRGHGESGKPHEPAAYGEEMVEDIVRLLDHLRIRRAHVVGYSMGAEIALKTLTRYPDRIRSAVLGGSGWSSDREYDLYKILRQSMEDGTGLGPCLEAATLPGQLPPPAEQVAEWDRMLLSKADTRALAALLRHIEEFHVTEEELRAITLPVLGVAGEFDGERPMLERMLGVVPDFAMVVLSGLDHGGVAFDPKLARTTLDFLRRVSASPSLEIRP